MNQAKIYSYWSRLLASRMSRPRGRRMGDGSGMVKFSGRIRTVFHVISPAAVYLSIQFFTLGVLAIASAHAGLSLFDCLHAWDGDWLLAIASSGYDGVPVSMVDAFGSHGRFTSLGFFPGYPALVAALSVFTKNPLVSGLAISLVSGVIAAYGLARIGSLVREGSERAGLLLVGLFSAAPMAIVLSMTYTESLFCALAVWALVAMLRGHWIIAGLLTAAAGLVRPTATALIVAVGLAAIVEVVRSRGKRPWAAGLLVWSGLFSYLGYVAVRTGSINGWFRIQRASWGWYFDGGSATAKYVAAVLAGGQQIFDAMTVLVLCAGILLLILSIRQRIEWPLLVYACTLTLTVWMTAGLMNSKIRLLLPAFTLLLLPALGLSHRRTSTAVLVLVGIELISVWFSCYALTVWPYSI